MTKFSFAGSHVWVVGASSGIGAATAAEAHRRGARVTVTARRREPLEEVSGGRMNVVAADVTDADSVKRAWAEVITHGVPDVVIVSSGYWKQIRPATFDVTELRRHLDVNLMGLGNVFEHAVPALVARGNGTLVGIASVAGYRGLPGGEYYGATKAAQINLLEAMRGALRNRGVDVVTVAPGFVKTDMTEGNSFPMPFMVSAERAGREICDGIEAGRAEIVFPKRMAVLMKSARFVPVRAWSELTGRLGRRS